MATDGWAESGAVRALRAAGTRVVMVGKDRGGVNPGLMLLALHPVAAAHVVSMDTIRSWLPGLQAAIEADQGRKFAEMPRVRISTVAEVERIARAHGAEGTPGDALGAYLPANQTVYILDDGLRGLYGKQTIQPDEFAAVTKCVVAHELVHALQDQHNHARSTGRGYLAVLEGQAVTGAARVCAHPVASTLTAIGHGDDVLASKPEADELAFRYGYGARFVGAVHAAAGSEAVWSLLAAPPSDADIVGAVRPTLRAGWADTSPLRGKLDAIGAIGAEEKNGDFSPWYALSVLEAGSPDSGRLTYGEAGLRFERRDGDRRWGAIVLRLRDAAEPSAWLRRRRIEVDVSRAWWFLWDLEDALGATAARFAARGLDETLVVSRYGYASRYREYWAARDGVVAGVFATDPAEAPKMRDAVTSLVEHYSSLVAEREGVDVDAWTRLPPMSATVVPGYVLRRMRRAGAEGAPADCEQAGRALIAQVAETDRPIVDEAIAACRSPTP